MPHVTFVPLTGFRVREPEMRRLGMSLPGLTSRAAALAELPALGMLTLAGLTPKPWSCSYHGVQTYTEKVVQQITDEQPDLVAISALTASVEEAYILSDRVRAAGVQVVMGGLHVSACPEEAETHCDAVIVGRGERVWHQVLQDTLGGQLQRRYTSEGNLPPLWPMPRFELLGHRPPRFTLQTQTGCPFSCDFCGSSRLLGRFFEKPIENIREELAIIAQITPRPMIELADDNTFAGSRNVQPLFNAFSAVNARWFTEADWRIGECADVLRGLAASGCVQVLVGIESLVFRYPGMGKKQAELDRIMNAVTAIQDAGVAVNGCFIAGAEGETPESLDRLTDFLLRSPLAEVQVTLQTPFPGTALHRSLADQGRLLEDRGWSAYSLFDVTYRPDRMSVAELESGFRNVLKRVFSEHATKRRNDIRRRIMRRARSLRSQHSE
ncbi:B12-binding domain-containing radical SAM protein [Fuerstiella marisgermanici]|uniref:Hopanoid biosynthesis associated radical SAM protein HpnJ n=1 Tax=Fuerstiella marisgermanici TaxID=1891926 RepID=A0A1P8WD88_9PLAN|nr:cobalamin-dependent protein [Fuerstiella marisgermanici]APZ92020.1 hopanoid biosynthesis associated radical SAM protein HpnJ [Fuerstiella marisgermanici]